MASQSINISGQNRRILPKIIDPSVRSRIINLHLEGRGRNAIAEAPGVKEYASAGTVSSVIKKYQSEPKSATTPSLKTLADETFVELEVKKNPDLSVENHLVKSPETGVDIIENSEAETPRPEQVQLEEKIRQKEQIENGDHVKRSK